MGELTMEWHTLLKYKTRRSSNSDPSVKSHMGQHLSRIWTQWSSIERTGWKRQQRKPLHFCCCWDLHQIKSEITFTLGHVSYRIQPSSSWGYHVPFHNVHLTRHLFQSKCTNISNRREGHKMHKWHLVSHTQWPRNTYFCWRPMSMSRIVGTVCECLSIHTLLAWQINSRQKWPEARFLVNRR